MRWRMSCNAGGVDPSQRLCHSNLEGNHDETGLLCRRARSRTQCRCHGAVGRAVWHHVCRQRTDCDGHGLRAGCRTARASAVGTATASPSFVLANPTMGAAESSSTPGATGTSGASSPSSTTSPSSTSPSSTPPSTTSPATAPPSTSPTTPPSPTRHFRLNRRARRPRQPGATVRTGRSGRRRGGRHVGRDVRWDPPVGFARYVEGARESASGNPRHVPG